jgi:hypothetical protein
MTSVQYAILAYIVGVGLLVSYAALLWARALTIEAKHRR